MANAFGSVVGSLSKARKKRSAVGGAKRGARAASSLRGLGAVGGARASPRASGLRKAAPLASGLGGAARARTRTTARPARRRGRVRAR